MQKYVGYDKRYIFDLLNSTQEKIAKKYYKNRTDTKDINENDISVLYISKLNLLKYSKEKVKQNILDDKKGNTLTNAFSFFFGGKSEKKDELTNEENDEMNKIYTDEYINIFLKEYESIHIEDFLPLPE